MSAFALRVVACVAMLLDHVGYAFGTSCPPLSSLRIIGRIAFPLFVFLIVNGCRHTKSPARYILRLALFAMLSQVPFSLFCYAEPWYGKGNAYVTLLFACLSVLCAREICTRGGHKLLAALPGCAMAALLHLSPIPTDYGAKGVLLALVFWLFDGKPVLIALGMVASLFYPQLLSLLSGDGLVINAWALMQMSALLALVPIRCYNGQPGWRPQGKAAAKAVQLGFYFFYPVHMLLLWMISQ